MKEFSSFFALAEFIETRAAVLAAGREELLTIEAKRLETEAKAMFGVYQEGWEQLKDETQSARARKGFTPNDPLLVTGDLRGNVSSRVEGNMFEVGSPDDIMYWQEYGTSTIPPRPVFGLLLQNERETSIKNLSLAVFKLITA